MSPCESAAPAGTVLSNGLPFQVFSDSLLLPYPGSATCRRNLGPVYACRQVVTTPLPATTSTHSSWQRLFFVRHRPIYSCAGGISAHPLTGDSTTYPRKSPPAPGNFDPNRGHSPHRAITPRQPQHGFTTASVIDNDTQTSSRSPPLPAGKRFPTSACRGIFTFGRLEYAIRAGGALRTPHVRSKKPSPIRGLPASTADGLPVFTNQQRFELRLASPARVMFGHKAHPLNPTSPARWHALPEAILPQP